MTIGEILLIALFVIVFVGIFGGLFYLIRVEEKLEKESKPIPPERDIHDIDNYEPFQERQYVLVVDMFCKSELVGMKLPESVQTFIIRFEDEYGKQFDMPVIEDYYQSFDIGQRGILTTVDGEFYSFEAE
jgi:hypothetical protein